VCHNSIYAREAFFIYTNSGQHLTRELRAIRGRDIGLEIQYGMTDAPYAVRELPAVIATTAGSLIVESLRSTGQFYGGPKNYEE
jgi:hypothetical protein